MTVFKKSSYVNTHNKCVFVSDVFLNDGVNYLAYEYKTVT